MFAVEGDMNHGRRFVCYRRFCAVKGEYVLSFEGDICCTRRFCTV